MISVLELFEFFVFSPLNEQDEGAVYFRGAKIPTKLDEAPTKCFHLTKQERSGAERIKSGGREQSGA